MGWEEAVEEEEEEVRVMGSEVATQDAVLREYIEIITSTQATGCLGAGSYRQVFRGMGYPHLAVMSDMSSAGDWWFIVSEDGQRWYNANQENRWPDNGFNYYVDRDTWAVGTEEEALEAMWELAMSS